MVTSADSTSISVTNQGFDTEHDDEEHVSDWMQEASYSTDTAGTPGACRRPRCPWLVSIVTFQLHPRAVFICASLAMERGCENEHAGLGVNEAYVLRSKARTPATGKGADAGRYRRLRNETS